MAICYEQADLCSRALYTVYSFDEAVTGYRKVTWFIGVFCKQQQDEDENEDDFNLEHLPDADAENPFRLVEMQFDRMYYRNLILYGLKELRNRINEETYQIFDLAMIQRRPSKDVADFFDVTVNYVNKVKRDNCERLRQMLQEFSQSTIPGCKH